MRRFTGIFLVAAIAGCGRREHTTPRPVAINVALVGHDSRSTEARGALNASPNPIQVCDGSGHGESNVGWSVTGSSLIEIHVGKPAGDLFVHAGPKGSWKTGKWVTSGMKLYLQDVSNNRSLTSDNTIDVLRFTVTDTGCKQAGLI